MNKKQILDGLDLGSSVAENDNNLPSYFVPTVALSDFLGDRYDLIRGAKGSGKSAILRLVSQEQNRYPQLDDVALVVATEHTGEPAFRQAFERIGSSTVEPDVVAAWKVYLHNLVLDCIEALPSTSESKSAVAFAESCGVRYRTSNPFKKIWWSLLRVCTSKRLGWI